MDQHVIELVHLTKKYGAFTAVDDLNLTIQKGEIFGLLGPNGAGKSTTILMMLGLAEPTSGIAKVCSINSTTNPIEVKRRVGYLPEDVGFYDQRTGFENLMYTARLNGIPEEKAVQQATLLLEKVGLTDSSQKKTGKYSRGMRQRLGLADVLIKNPEVIILDEPTSGIDPKGVREFLNLIVDLSRGQGLTVLFASHNLHQVQEVCDRVGIFVNGKLLGQGNIQILSQQLFKDRPYLLYIGIQKQNAQGQAVSVTLAEVSKLLQSVDAISSISVQQDLFCIESTRDVTSQVAALIVQSGYTMLSLNKKEYGLDEIYYQYFEGGTTHE